MTESLQNGLKDRETSHPVMVCLLREVLRVYPPIASALLWMTQPDQASVWDDGERHIGRLLEARRSRGVTNASLARAFITNCVDYLKEQTYFVRHGSYREESNEALIETLYHNENEMSAYMDGLLVTLFTWRNHYAIFRFYRDAFLPSACAPEIADPEGIEIGPGHGLFFVLALLAKERNARGVGVDVSPTSITLTAELARAYGINDSRFGFVEHNVKDPLPFDDGRFAYAVTGEVLEHVDDPAFLLRELRRVTRKGGKAFVTTVINAAARDHVFLFRSEREVADLLRGEGWTIEKSLVMEVPLPESLRKAGAGSENCAYIVS